MYTLTHTHIPANISYVLGHMLFGFFSFMLCAQVSRHYARQFWAPCNHINALASACVCVCVSLSLVASYDGLVVLGPTQISFIIWSSSVG